MVDCRLGRQINNQQSQSKISNRKNPQSSISTPQSNEDCGFERLLNDDCDW